MRRPLVPIGAAFALAILLGYYIKAPLFFSVTSLSIVLSFIFMRKKVDSTFLFMVSFLVATVAFWYQDYTLEKNLPKFEEIKTIEGNVISCRPKEGDGFHLVVESKDQRYLVSYYGKVKLDEDIVGRQVTVTGEVTAPSVARNPKCFDYRLYLKTEGIGSIINGKSIKTGSIKLPIRYWAYRISIDFGQSISKYMDEDTAQLVLTMLFGNRFSLEDQVYYEFQRNGTAHLLAASGLHVAMVYSLVALVIGGKHRPWPNLLILAALILYSAMAGFAPSVVRAVAMVGLHTYSRLAHRKYDLTSAALATLVVMLAINPYSLMAVGFQMSFLAIFIIARFNRYMANAPRKWKGVKGSVLLILVIQGAMTPYTAYVFNYVSISSFIANGPLIFISGILIPFAIVALVVTVAFPVTTPVFAVSLDIMGKGLYHINSLFYNQGAAAYDVVSPSIVLVAAFYLVGFYLTSDYGRIYWGRSGGWDTVKRRLRGEPGSPSPPLNKNKPRPTLSTTTEGIEAEVSRPKANEKAFWWPLAMVLMVAIMLGAVQDHRFDSVKIVFVDIGQGDCLFVQSPKGKNLLFDGGGKADYDVGRKTVKPFLLKNQIPYIDLGVVSHLDTDHYDGIRTLHQDGFIRQVAFHKWLKGQVEGRAIFLETGDIILREDDFYVEVLGPVTRGKDENDNSLVVMINYKGLKILAPGDISSQTEAEMVEYYRGTDKMKADILLVAHHGSKYSSSMEFIEAVSPKVAIIQVGKNRYGHPDRKVIDNYENSSIMVLRTDYSGAIGINGDRNVSIIRQIK